MRRISGSGFKGSLRPVSLCAAILMSAATPLAAEGLNANQQRAFDIYKELIEINTVTATGDTAKAAEAMAARLRTGGFPDADVHAHETPAELLPDAPGDVEPRHVIDGEHPHRHPPARQHAIHLLRRRPFLDEELRLVHVGEHHAVADEPRCVADDARQPRRAL